MDRADVWMIERTDDLGFALKSSYSFWPTAGFGMQGFEANRTSQATVTCLEDNPHATSADFAKYFVPWQLEWSRAKHSPGRLAVGNRAFFDPNIERWVHGPTKMIVEQNQFLQDDFAKMLRTFRHVVGDGWFASLTPCIFEPIAVRIDD